MTQNLPLNYAELYTLLRACDIAIAEETEIANDNPDFFTTIYAKQSVEVLQTVKKKIRVVISEACEEACKANETHT